MKQINTLFIGLLLLLLLITSANISAAPSGSTSNSTTVAGCQPELKTFLDKETKEYENFMKTHLQSKKATSDLMNIANQKYMQYRAKLLNKRSKLSYSTTSSSELAVRDVQVCQRIIDKYLLAAENYQRTMIVSNAQRKKTIRMAERLHDINKKLNQLNREVGTIHGYLKVFSQKVPCYVNDCPL